MDPAIDTLKGYVERTDPGGVLITTAHQHAACLRGPEIGDLLDRVPVEDLRRSIHDSLEPLLEDLTGDERNVLLTLARMLVTLDTGRIVPKDEAADQIRPGVGDPHRSELSLAARGYLGLVADEWSDRRSDAAATAEYLADRIRACGRAQARP